MNATPTNHSRAKAAAEEIAQMLIHIFGPEQFEDNDKRELVSAIKTGILRHFREPDTADVIAKARAALSETESTLRDAAELVHKLKGIYERNGDDTCARLCGWSKNSILERIAWNRAALDQLDASGKGKST